MNVAVLGSGGRMGTVITPAIVGADDLELVDSYAKADVVVDVTNATAARDNLPLVAGSGAHGVVGTTGFDDVDIAAFHRVFVEAGKACLLVPNFAIGAVLMMKFAADAAQYFDGVEIIELHHDQKKDAPSGTAALTADRIGGEVPIHSVRLRGLVAHQEVLFGADGQTLTIRHDTTDRSAFVPGVLRAIRNIGSLPPGVTTGLEAVL